jgi:6-phosphogluconolactonase
MRPTRGSLLVASGEKSDHLSVYEIDQSTGELGEPSRYPAGNGANWVEIVDVQWCARLLDKGLN